MAALKMDHEALLAHTGWLRSLARGLVSDPAQADDLVQETWVRALKSPPRRDDNPRGWLRAVLRNVFLQSRRGEDRRREREREAARPEGAQPAVDELLERAVLHGRLVELLTTLEEPFRTALLLRYFDGLGPREIAARLGVPLDTVRSRLRRGLARLRERLDARGDRNACAILLAPLLAPPAAAPASCGTAAGFGRNDRETQARARRRLRPGPVRRLDRTPSAPSDRTLPRAPGTGRSGSANAHPRTAAVLRDGARRTHA